MRDGMHRFAFVAILISGGLVSAPCLAQGGGSKPKPPSPTPPPVTIQTPAVLWNPGHTITVNIADPNTGDATRDAAYLKAATDALDGWNKEQQQFGGDGYKVKYIVGGIGSYDVTIVWENNPNRDTNGDLDLGWTVTTASHGPQADGGIPIYKNASSQIHLSKTDASGKPITSQSMQYLTQHEFGHAEGVGHVSGGVMASGKDTVIPPGKQTPDPVDLSSDTSAKTGKSAIHDTKPHKGWGSINLNTQNTPSGKLNIMNFSWNASADYYPGGFSELGVRLGDANPVVSLPTGWDWQFIPDDTSSELLVNGHPGFDLPGDGIGWLTLFADDPSFYATAASGFDFSVASSLDFATLYGLTIFELHPDGNATLYQTVPEPGSLALLLSGIFGIASRRLRMTGILRRRNS